MGFVKIEGAEGKLAQLYILDQLSSCKTVDAARAFLQGLMAVKGEGSAENPVVIGTILRSYAGNTLSVPEGQTATLHPEFVQYKDEKILIGTLMEALRAKAAIYGVYSAEKLKSLVDSAVRM